MSNKKEVVLKHRLSTSGYHMNNLKSKEMRRKKLGSSMNAVNTLLSYDNFSTSVVAKIIRNSSDDVKFDQRVEEYFDAISINVPFEGKPLNIALRYKSEELKGKYEDQELAIRKQFHTKLLAQTNNPAAQKETFAIRTEKLIELEEAKLGAGAKPVNIEHYLIWRYALVNSEVANREADTGASLNIRFYLSDTADNLLIKKDKEDKVVLAHKKFTDIMGDSNKVNDLYEVLYPKGTDKLIPTRQVKLMEYILRNPNTFLAKMNDKDINVKASIERLIVAGILKRFPSSSLITDAMTQEKIGKNVEQAVEWFNNPDNKKTVEQFNNRYKNSNI